MSAAVVVVLTACTEAPEEVCEGGFDDSTCTMDMDHLYQCDACGQSWACSWHWDDNRRWIQGGVSCVCVCGDGGTLNSSNMKSVCYLPRGEHNEEDTGPYRETCDDPPWYEL